MKENKTSIVVTSIFEPNESLRKLAKGAVDHKWDFIIVGDVKSPKDFELEGATFFDLSAQREFDFKLAPLCPERHYTRKNLGYLMAIKNGGTIIVETDDDNIPHEDFWLPRSNLIKSSEANGSGWINVYSLFSDTGVWPRGLPLEDVFSRTEIALLDASKKSFHPIQQGLANGNPDVDAVFRMTRKLPIDFLKRKESVSLQKGLWSPFNSQNTTWFKEAFPLLYLPSFCTFRMTDIWRSFVAQRIMWECGWQLLFHNATVHQERNEHNLLRDFEQEVPGYLLNNQIRQILEDLPLCSGTDKIPDNLRACYKALIEENIISDVKELDLLEAWLSDIKRLTT